MKISLVLMTIVVISCGKKDKDSINPSSNNPANTGLKFKIKGVYCTNTAGYVADAYIELFNSESDRDKRQNVVASGKTDSNGEAVITGLKSQIYYYNVEKVCMNRIYYNCQSTATNGAIQANTITEVSMTLCNDI